MGRKKTKPTVAYQASPTFDEGAIDWAFDYIFSQVSMQESGKEKKK